MPSLTAVRTRATSIARAHRSDPSALAAEAVRLALAGDEQLGFEVFRAAPRVAATLPVRQIERLLPVLHDWNSTDCFGCFVSGVAWREGGLKDAQVAAWARAEGRWVRRAALVSTVPLNLPARGATAPHGEAKKTLAICRRLLDDRDDMVVKALSWALRVLARKDPEAVGEFVEEHRHRLAPRVVRETTNKLETGLKNPKRSRG